MGPVFGVDLVSVPGLVVASVPGMVLVPALVWV